METIPLSFPVTLLDGLTWDGKNFFICDAYDGMIYKLSRQGELLWSFPGPGSNATELEWDGRYLWVSDIVTDYIYQLNLTGAPPDTVPIISISPAYFNFTAEIGGANPPDRVLRITNGGAGELNWSISDNADWLSLNPLSGTAPAEVVLSVDISGLEVGIYKASVVIEAVGAYNSPKTVPVTLTVKPNVPTIALSCKRFSFSSVEGEANPNSQILNISNAGGGTLNWTAAENANWLSLSTYQGTASSDVELLVDITGLIANSYYDYIVISCDNATNSPESVLVVLTVSPHLLPSDDTVRVGTATGKAGTQVVVPVRIHNTVPIAGFDIPLKYSSSAIVCDSVSYIGSRAEYIDLKVGKIDSLNRTILIAGVALAEPPIPSGNGLLANLYFTINQNAPDSIIDIDTCFIPPSNFLSFYDVKAIEIKPVFIRGHVIVGKMTCGDVDGNDKISLADVIYLANYLFKGGPAPYQLYSGDTNADSKISLPDAIYLANYLLKGNLPPL